jgi:uncharacterized membrane protein
MISRNLRILTVATAVGAATVGGVLLAFSTFVMKALKQLPDSEGIAAMQSINRAAPSPLFMIALFGTAAASVGLGVVAIQRRGDPYSTYLLIGAGLYLAGIILTIAYHVPHNDALALVDPTSAGAAATWHHYVTNWTFWNHVRTLTSIAGSTMLVLALNAD